MMYGEGVDLTVIQGLLGHSQLSTTAGGLAFEDDQSAAFTFGSTIVNLLKSSAAGELIGPARVAGPNTGVRVQLTINVDDVDATCEELTSRGVELLNGPMDRPWGVRTAAFADPGGQIWEIAK